MDDICLIWAPVITAVVSACKWIPFVGRYPKIWAMVLSVALAAWRAKHPGAVTPGMGDLLACIAAQFSVAVATFETVVKPAAKLAARSRTPRR